MKKFWCWGTIPLIVGVYAILFTIAAGPYWLAAHIDPAYPYLFNYLYLLDRLPLYPTSHPGLTLDLLGALTFKFCHPTLNHQDFFLAIIQDPEFYLHLLHYIMVLFYVFSLGFLGFFAYKKSQDVLFPVLVQLSSLLVLAIPSTDDNTVLPILAHVKPETLLATAVNLLMIGLLGLYWDTLKGKKWALYLGFVCAFGLFTKYTFVLCVALVFCVLPGLMSRGLFLLTFIIFGYIFYNVETDPYHRILLWVRDLIFKSGYTGGMSEKFIEPAVFIPALIGLIKHNLFVFLTAGVALIASSISIVRGIRKQDKFLWLVSGFTMLQFLVVAKHPSAHYMVPAIGLSSLVLVLLYDKFRDRLPSRLMYILICLFVVFNMAELTHYVLKLSKRNKAMERYAQGLSAAYPGYVICPFFEASSPIFALACATDNMHTYYNVILKKMYPDYYYYETNAHDFKDFLSRWTPLSEIASGHKGVLLYGNSISEDFFKPDTIVHEIERTPEGESLYVVVSQQSPHAKDYLLYSLVLFKQGQYKAALQYAIYAKQLGFPEDIGGYLNEIIARLKSSGAL